MLTGLSLVSHPLPGFHEQGFDLKNDMSLQPDHPTNLQCCPTTYKHMGLSQNDWEFKKLPWLQL